jgi:hypothetical protein
MNEQERYDFDIRGFCVLEDVLSSSQVAELNALLDDYDLWKNTGSGGLRDIWRRDESFMTVGPIHMWDKPFRELISNPAVLPYLSELIGPDFRYDHGHALIMRRGSQSLRLHGGGTPWDPGHFYLVKDGKIRNGEVTASYCLTDTPPGSGGFVAIPGSHKASFPLPAEYLSPEDGKAPIVHVPVRAGSVVIFSEALSHGTAPWTADYERRIVLVKYCPGNLAVAGVTEDSAPVREEEINSIPDRSQVERQLLRPPYQHGRTPVLQETP